MASPATVSRLGVLYMTPEELGWTPYVQSWIARECTGRLSADVVAAYERTGFYVFETGVTSRGQQGHVPAGRSTLHVKIH